MLKTKVKGSGIQHLTDARYFASRGATWLGFDAGTSDNALENAQNVSAIKEWVDGVILIGEFDVQPVEIITRWIQISGVEGIQIPGHRATDILPFIPSELFVIIDFSKKEDSELMRSLAPYSNAFLLNPSNQKYDFPILYNWDNSQENLIDFLQIFSPVGISLKGGMEEKVGIKSFDELDEIMDALTI